VVNGLVPYRDLVEQKGVLLYFLHGLAYLASNTTFIGVYFLEVVAGTAFLYCAAKTAALFVHGKWGYVIAPALAALVYASASFAHGDSAEEYCLPLLAAAFYRLMRFFKNREDLSPKAIAVTGVLAGCVLWIKYTMLGFMAGWMLAVFVGLLQHKQPRRAFAACLWFLLGMAAATLPWLIYFAVHGAISDWFHVYFYLNVTVYPVTAGLAEMLGSVWSTVYQTATGSPVLIVSIAAGLLGFVCTSKFIKGAWGKACYVLLPALLALGVYAGGRTYPYYFLILRGLLLLPGLIAAAAALEAPARAFVKASVKARLHVRTKAALAVTAAVALALSVYGAYGNCQYRGFMQENRKDLAQYPFAEIIKK
jgi:hypothetical protein